MAKALWLAAALASTVASAQDTGSTTVGGTTISTTPASERSTANLKPLQFDVRVNGDTDILLAYIDLGLTADIGLLPVGPGTLAVGASLDYGFCGSVCWLIGALTNTNYGQSYLQPTGRVSYHLDMKQLIQNQASLSDKLDGYALVFAGPILSSVGISSKDGSVKVEGTDLAFGGGAGLGAQYFFSANFFAGAEIVARYAAGTYTTKVTVGSYSVSDKESSWSLSGINTKLFLGLRFP